MSLRSREDVAAHVAAGVRFGSPARVGAELEWLVADRSAPHRRPRLERVSAALATALPLAGGSVLSTEPGGQVELSSLPCLGPGAAVAALSTDLHAVRGALAADGMCLVGMGADPARPAQRLVCTPRYEVMEAFYARSGEPCASAGRAMMCSSAAVQVSLDAGTSGRGTQSATERWQRAHAVGPSLVAAFSCSPLLDGRPTGWRSTRQRFWRDIDPSRTRPPAPGLDPVEALAELAVTARLMTWRDADGVCRPAPAGVTFGDWLAGASSIGGRVDGPTEADLDYHLTTLFPPVRLRQWIELRYLDALPDPLWQVAVAVATAVLDDDRAADAARAACAPVEGQWVLAARLGATDPALAAAATACLLATAEALPRLGAAELVPAVLAYAERFCSRGRSPADDLLDACAAGTPPQTLLLDAVEVAA